MNATPQGRSSTRHEWTLAVDCAAEGCDPKHSDDGKTSRVLYEPTTARTINGHAARLMTRTVTTTAWTPDDVSQGGAPLTWAKAVEAAPADEQGRMIAAEVERRIADFGGRQEYRAVSKTAQSHPNRMGVPIITLSLPGSEPIEAVALAAYEEVTEQRDRLQQALALVNAARVTGSLYIDEPVRSKIDHILTRAGMTWAMGRAVADLVQQFEPGSADDTRGGPR